MSLSVDFSGLILIDLAWQGSFPIVAFDYPIQFTASRLNEIIFYCWNFQYFITEKY